jgi:hydrogenase nickel incorporation protein HypA/HybF
MHEMSVLRSLMHKLDEVVVANQGRRVRSLRVQLGALSHFTAEHFKEHFVIASRGTSAEGARVDAVEMSDESDPNAFGVVLESVEIDA